MRGRSITRQDFTKVKRGQNLGMKTDNIAEYAKLSTLSVRRIMKANTWPEFQRMQKKQREYNIQHSTYHRKKQEVGTPIKVRVNKVDPYAEYNKSLMHMLRTLDSKVAHLEKSVDLLENEVVRSKKKRWF